MARRDALRVRKPRMQYPIEDRSAADDALLPRPKIHTKTSKCGPKGYASLTGVAGGDKPATTPHEDFALPLPLLPLPHPVRERGQASRCNTPRLSLQRRPVHCPRWVWHVSASRSHSHPRPPAPAPVSTPKSPRRALRATAAFWASCTFGSSNAPHAMGVSCSNLSGHDSDNGHR